MNIIIHFKTKKYIFHGIGPLNVTRIHDDLFLEKLIKTIKGANN